MSVLRSVRDHFLVPAAATGVLSDERALPEPRVQASPAAIAVLCAPRVAAALGGALATALAVRSGGAALVCLWGAAASTGRAPAMPSARRLAGGLQQRGHPAVATGRIVRVTLEGDDGAVAAEAGRVLAAAAAPTVLVVAGPRGERMDGLLRAQDLVVVAGAQPGGDAHAIVAAERLEADGVAVLRRAAPTGVAAVCAARGVAGAGISDDALVRAR